MKSIFAYVQVLIILYLENIFHWICGYTASWQICRDFCLHFLNNVVKFHGELRILSVSSTLRITMSKVENYEPYFTISNPDYFQQYIVIKFFQKWVEMWKETLDALCVVNVDDVMQKSLFYKWYKQFADGRKACADAPRSSRPVSMRNTTSIEKVKLVLHNDHYSDISLITLV